MTGTLTSSSANQQEFPQYKVPGSATSSTSSTTARLPRFIIIGAPKAATTWLSTVLSRQPDLFMPKPEVHFYNRHYERGLDWYASHFAPAAPGQLVGEKSASYLADPLVPARIKATLPGVLLVAQLRNPIERAYSDYCMLLRRGEVTADVARHLDPVHAPTRRFVDDGLYGRQIAAFLEVFPRDQLHVLFYEDIAGDPLGVFAGVAAFLRLSDPVRPDVLARRVKDKQTPMLPLPVRRLLRPLKGAVQPVRAHPLFRRVHGLIARPVRYPPLDARTRGHLAEYYADDVRELGRSVGRDLDGWLRRSSGAGAAESLPRGA